MFKILGVVILYYPDESVLYQNIYSYLGDIDKLLIIDNTSEGLKLNFDFFAGEKKIVFQKQNRNKGVGFALNFALDYATNNDFDFILTMDQDSRFESGALKVLIESVDTYPDAAIYCPFQANKLQTKTPVKGFAESKKQVMTSGNLVNVKKANQAGGFNAEYFIDHIDTEFCLKLQINSFPIYMIHDSILIHHEGDIREKHLFGLRFYPINNSPIRYYYKSRNLLNIIFKYGLKLPDRCIEEVIYFSKQIFKMIVFETNKMSKLKFIMVGFIHFIFGKTGEFKA